MSDLIEVYAKRLKAAGRSAKSIETRSRVLRHAHRWLIANMEPDPENSSEKSKGLDQANGDDISNYLARQPEFAPRPRPAGEDDRLAPWSQATMYTHLRGYYKAMVKAGRLTKDPTDYIDRPASGDCLPDPVEDWQLIAAIDRSPDPWRTSVIIAAYAGLRCCELVALDRADVTKTHVHVTRGKGGKGRYVPTHPKVWDLVKDRPPGLLIVSKTGRPIDPQVLSSQQHAHWCSLDMPDVHMHRFRHWFGTTLADNEVGIEVIQEMMGHASIMTTRGYLRVSVKRKEAAMAALPSLGGNVLAALHAVGVSEHQPAVTRLVPTAA